MYQRCNLDVLSYTKTTLVLRRKLSKPVQTPGAAHPPGPSRPSNSVTVSEREESQYNEVYVIGA